MHGVEIGLQRLFENPGPLTVGRFGQLIELCHRPLIHPER